MTSVSEIEVVSARIPLPKPVYLGTIRIDYRDYVAIKLSVSDGSIGYAYGYDRGMPLFEICVAAARKYLGQPASERNRIRKQALGPTPAPRASMTRGVSLCDIALWDAWCISQKVPLWEALGGSRLRVPLMPIIGYGMTPEIGAEQAARLASQGFGTIKCMIDGRDFAADRALVRAIAQALPPSVRLGLDAHWSWTSVAEAMPWCRLAESVDAAFLEDPFGPTQREATSELSRRASVPIAVGEDVVDIYGLRDAAASAGILRIDASVSGGVSSAVEAIAIAQSLNRPVIPHVFPGLHAHFGFAFDTVKCIEMITREVAADPIDQFLIPLSIDNGDLVASEQPGAGTSISWRELGPYITRTEGLAS